MKLRKPVNELTPEDLRNYPVWEYALDEEGDEGQDETTVRPYQFAAPLDPAESMFVIGASFTLADGTLVSGYLTPPSQGDDSLATLQPAITTNAGQVRFWFGRLPFQPEEIAKMYSLLGKESSSVFPITFRATVAVVGGDVAGQIPGFLRWESLATKRVLVIQ